MAAKITVAKLERLYGRGNSVVGRALGVSHQLVAYWRRNGISKPRQALIRERIGRQ